MGLLTLHGIQVDFPFEPYPSQIVYMESVVKSLLNKEHALLESPTGTGKTLCLLCATLGWQKYETERLRQEQAKRKQKMKEDIGMELAYETRDGVEAKVNVQLGEVPDSPVIIYASRTHSQLKQVVNELKNTNYRPDIAILGSRQHLCVNKKVSKYTGTAQTHMCRSERKNNKCVYRNGYDSQKKTRRKPIKSIVDIEELVKILESQKICPFYTSRDMKSNAQILFLPYNYLFEPKYRESIGISLDNTVIILDEAHNVESVAVDAASFDISSTDIAGCIEEVSKCLDYLVEGEIGGADLVVLNQNSCATLKRLFLEIEKGFDKHQLPQDGSGITKGGDYILDFFAAFNITFDTVSTVMQIIEETIEFLTDRSPTRPKSHKLEYMLSCLSRVFRNSAVTKETIRNQYRVHIRDVIDKETPRNRRGSLQAFNRPSKIRVMSYWCFFPGVAMKELASSDIHNIILTSGTLSPLSTTARELGLDFPIQIENGHVIDPEQVWVGVVGTGVRGRKLNSCFRNRNSSDYIEDLGQTITNLARIVPNGLLVFFPSFSIMNNCIQHWQQEPIQSNQKSIWERIGDLKTTFIETSGSAEFKQVVEDYGAAIKENPSGAVLFGVCRGKVSEGIDFSNANGRAVVITGVPFPPLKDPKVVLKKNYLDSQTIEPGKQKLTGAHWYSQQADRAVNQAIGRVIRHRNDFGAIILCDERFSQPQQIHGLSKWIQPQVSPYPTFGKANLSLVQFFKKHLRSHVVKEEALVPEIPMKMNIKKSQTLEPPAAPPAREHSMPAEDLDDFSQRSVVGEGQTYINPQFFNNPRPRTEINQAKPLSSEVRFKESPKALSLKEALEEANASTSTFANESFSQEPQVQMKLSEKYGQDTSRPSSSTDPLPRFLRGKKFGLGNTRSMMSGSSANASELITAARRVLKPEEYTTLVRLFKKLRAQDGSNAERTMEQLFDLLKTPDYQHLLLIVKKFLRPSDFLIYKSCLRKYAIASGAPPKRPIQGVVDRFAIVQQEREAKRQRELELSKFAATVENPQCLICLSRCRKPHASPCGHICCLKCWLKFPTSRIKCPGCQVVTLTIEQLRPLRVASSEKRSR